MKCQLFMQISAAGTTVPFQQLDREMDQLFPFIYALIDDNDKAPKDGNWLQHIASVAMAVYRLSRPAIRQKFIVAVHHGLFSGNNLNLTMEEEDLWSMSFAAVLKRVADPSRDPIDDPEKFLFKTARHLFQSEIRRVNHERVMVREAARRAANRMRRAVWLRHRGIENLAADVEEELPRFVADKVRQQARSRRTRAIAEARVKGFAMVLQMLLQHPERTLDACRIRVERIVDRINRSSPSAIALVPSRSTFFRWANELVGRIRERADRRVVFPYTQAAATL
ncbi:MAG TPA: hypothetical protein VNA69_20575 [Thermoanaerobaculia bacterium]|nr:hypothetical protein [Thermoanaerobaculia bacterium]